MADWPEVAVRALNVEPATDLGLAWAIREQFYGKIGVKEGKVYVNDYTFKCDAELYDWLHQTACNYADAIAYDARDIRLRCADPDGIDTARELEHDAAVMKSVVITHAGITGAVQALRTLLY